MTPSLLKSSEQLFRSVLLRILARLVRRQAPAPSAIQLSKARILLIRQDRIGDVLVSTPFVSALSRRLPACTLDMLVSNNNVAAVEGVDGLRHAWIYTKNIVESIRLIRNIRRERYDVAVDLMDNPSATSTVFVLLSGARWTMGLDKANAFAYDIRVPLLSRKDVHIVDRIAELLRPFGIDPSKEDLRIRFSVGAKHAEEARRLLGKTRAKRLIGLNISAGSEARYWGTDRFTELVRGLHRAFPRSRVVLLSKPSDRLRAESIAAADASYATAISSSSFGVFAALARECSLLITPDTSAIHLAAAYKVPCIGLFIQTDPALRIWAPYRSPHRSLTSKIDSLSPITPESVIAAARELMTSTRPGRSRAPRRRR